MGAGNAGEQCTGSDCCRQGEKNSDVIGKEIVPLPLSAGGAEDKFELFKVHKMLVEQLDTYEGGNSDNVMALSTIREGSQEFGSRAEEYAPRASRDSKKKKTRSKEAVDTKGPAKKYKLEELEILRRATWCYYCVCGGCGCTEEEVMSGLALKCICCSQKCEHVGMYDHEGICSCKYECCMCAWLSHWPAKASTPPYMCCNERVCFKLHSGKKVNQTHEVAMDAHHSQHRIGDDVGHHVHYASSCGTHVLNACHGYCAGCMEAIYICCARPTKTPPELTDADMDHPHHSQTFLEFVIHEKCMMWYCCCCGVATSSTMFECLDCYAKSCCCRCSFVPNGSESGCCTCLLSIWRCHAQFRLPYQKDSNPLCALCGGRLDRVLRPNQAQSGGRYVHRLHAPRQQEMT